MSGVLQCCTSVSPERFTHGKPKVPVESRISRFAFDGTGIAAEGNVDMIYTASEMFIWCESCIYVEIRPQWLFRRFVGRILGLVVKLGFHQFLRAVPLADPSLR